MSERCGHTIELKVDDLTHNAVCKLDEHKGPHDDGMFSWYAEEDCTCSGYWRDPYTGREYDQGGNGRVWMHTGHESNCPLYKAEED